MTDNGIIKALECCQQCVYGNCPECPMYEVDGCDSELMKCALGLIKRQQAEIDKLKKLSELPNFEKDYIISWDFSDSDFPYVRIIALHRDIERGTHIVAEDIGCAYRKIGAVSLRQLLAIHDERKRLEEATK